MRDRINARSMSIAAALLLEGGALYVVAAPPQRWRSALIVKEEPAARARYEAMLQAMQAAHSLSYTSRCSAPDGSASVYRVWRKRPNVLRVEQTNETGGFRTKGTTFLDDGTHLWVHWSGDRPGLLIDTQKSWEQMRSDVYVKQASLAGADSLRGKIALFGTAWLELILEPGTFHGYPDPLDPYIDGIRSRGTNRVHDEECDVIEISFMGAQRTRYLWLSRQDHLPRKIKEIVRDADTRVTVEEWSDVTVNAEIPAKMLAWSPPQGWRQWDPPKLEDSLLPNGQEAPAFELRAAHAGKIKLSDYRGKVVWLYVWSAGSPQCREDIPGLQQLHQDYGDKGLAILGFNCTDDRRIAGVFLRENAVTLPSVLDASESATRLMRLEYGNKAGLLPLHYILEPQGKVVDAWFGREQNAERVLAALKKAGLELAQ
ncbi:MAG: redoxin domain-containing protein [Planctomycetes bacterium]|nr:redoxin domain-containing protein [Planctomycetota bacterium]